MDDEAFARLAQVRIEIERHETEIWRLTREADELRAQIRIFNAKAPGAVANFAGNGAE